MGALGARSEIRMGTAVVLSVLGMAFHTVREFGPSGLLDPSTGMIPVAAVQGVLFVSWRLRPEGRSTTSLALLVTALFQLVGGAVLSVMPLPFLPFEPEQTLSHYLSHAGPWSRPGPADRGSSLE